MSDYLAHLEVQRGRMARQAEELRQKHAALQELDAKILAFKLKMVEDVKDICQFIQEQKLGDMIQIDGWGYETLEIDGWNFDYIVDQIMRCQPVEEATQWAASHHDC